MSLNSNFTIRHATVADISAIVGLSDIKRKDYEQIQPLFWRRAKDASQQQSIWFEELLEHENFILLVAEKSQKIVGFIIGQVIAAPAVYDPGGQSLMIDDFCVLNNQWEEIGQLLLDEMKACATFKNLVQLIAVAGSHDLPKKQFFLSQNLSLTSDWYTAAI